VESLLGLTRLQADLRVIVLEVSDGIEVDPSHRDGGERLRHMRLFGPDPSTHFTFVQLLATSVEHKVAVVALLSIPFVIVIGYALTVLTVSKWDPDSDPAPAAGERRWVQEDVVVPGTKDEVTGSVKRAISAICTNKRSLMFVLPSRQIHVKGDVISGSVGMTFSNVATLAQYYCVAEITHHDDGEHVLVSVRPRTFVYGSGSTQATRYLNQIVRRLHTAVT